MPIFHYRALGRNGAATFGTLEAASRGLAVETLTARGEIPVAVEGEGASLLARLNRPIAFRSRVTRRDVLALTRELARLLKAGIPLERALAILIETREGTRLEPLLKRVFEKVREGGTLSHALAAEKNVFPLFYLQIVRAGEASGTLEETCQRLAQLLERQHAFRSAIVSALIYPSILTVMVAVTLVIVIGVVLPEFETIFAGAGDKLPIATRIVMALGIFLHDYGWLLALVAAAAVVLIRRALRVPETRTRWDRRLIALKVLGPLLVKGEAALILRNLGSMLQNGVALPEATRLVASAIGNRGIAEDVAAAFGSVKEGQDLSVLLGRIKYFPRTALHLIRVGEETGNLGGLLEEAATLLEAEVETAMKRFLALFAPALTLAMGALIAAIIGTVLLGILSINELAAG